MSEFADKVVVVTGGATGIGEAIVRIFAGEKARVVILDLNQDRAGALARDLGSHVSFGEIDVTKRPSVEAAFAQVVERLGGVDVLCANAGVSTMQKSVDLTDDDWNFNMDVNAKGVFLCNQIAVRHFIATGKKGVIVNTASLAGKVGAPLLAHYSASKFAVLGWTQGLARELAPKGIRVNAVCPGFVKTGMQDREVIWEGQLRGMTPEAVREEYVSLTPMGRIEEPEDVALVVRFLASESARFMTGQGINVTGGVRMD
jgi:meso-butanediol dehydrogenase/(S,S)-butanediol dehydrogenase/diacetyl reductase